MGALLSLLYGVAAYLFFACTFVYAIGFIGGVFVPKTLDSGAPVPLIEAIAVNLLALGIFAVQHSVMARQWFMERWTLMRDIVMGLTKGLCFAILIVFISCHKGLNSREGAVGVGRATTEAVVNSSLAILISNFFLTMFLNVIFPAGWQ